MSTTWRVEDTGNAKNVLINVNTLEVSKDQSITGVAFWGGSATSPAFDIPAGVKEIWIKFDLCMRGTLSPCPFQVGHYSKTLGGLIGVENGNSPNWQGGNTRRNSFLIDAAPTTEIVTGITVDANANHKVLLHMVSSATDGVIEFIADGNVYTYTGNVNNGDDFDCIVFYSARYNNFTEAFLFSNIIISNNSVGLNENIGISSYFDVECEIENDALGWRYEDVALYVGTGAPLNFHVPRAYELWIRFDVYFDGVNRWYAYCEGVTGIIAIEPATLVFMSRDNVVNQVLDACKIKQTQTILLHMKSGTSDGVIEVWSGYEKIGEYTGNVNDGAAFGDFILRSDGTGTSFTELIISNEEIKPDEKPSNAVRSTKTSMLTVHNRKTYIKWSQPGGIYPRHYIKYNVDEVLKKTLTETSDSGEPVLIEIKSIWFKFDVYSDGSSAWQAYADGSSGKSGMSGLISGAVKLFANDADTDQFENICKAKQWQTFILHMDSSETEGLIEAQVDGGDIYRWTGNVNNGEEFTDVYLTSDNDEVTFQNFIVSTAPLDFGDSVSTVAETPATEKIFFNVRHQGEVLSVPFVAESATPAVAIRWGGRNWFNQILPLGDINATKIGFRHDNKDYAFSAGTNYWQYKNAGLAELLKTTGTTVEVDETKSVTGTAFYGSVTRVANFDVPAGLKEVWFDLDMYLDSALVQGNRFSFGHYSAALGGYVGIWNGGGNFSAVDAPNKFLIDATPKAAMNSTLSGTLGAINKIYLHMKSGVTDGVIEIIINNAMHSFKGNVNNGDDFYCLYIYSDSKNILFSNITVKDFTL